jgi:hypothetical protein
MEVNNYETFNKLLEIYNKNLENINIEFSFLGTGAAKILKLKNSNLTKPKKLNNRFYSLKNFFRKFYVFLSKVLTI